jgi:prephenate dehydrogenase
VARIIEPMRVAFLGFGLIAGSIARALREERDWELVAWSPRGEGPREAVADGSLDVAAASADGAIGGADVVVLAAPPLACLDLLDEIAGPLRAELSPRAVITDVASTKRAICARAAAHGLSFVGGHPMAGRESSGYGSSDADLFRDRPWVVVPGKDGGSASAAALVDRVEELALACRARPIRMDATSHDAAVAAVSHLPLVVSAALVEAVTGRAAGGAGPDWPHMAQLAASGWRDMTRLARGDVTMAAGIAATNAPALADRVRAMRATLDDWLEDLERDGGPDPDRLLDRFAQARDRASQDRP